ncbi:Neutral ceramidase 3 [Vitis vinifera]|uniref:Neutral ceramidase n=1 Tax=Vitis vinifera TaxID=29760 RepID=A0A438K4E1_VITVI|nr:Neutral ceramidase 3 [Vitis vinifera]
MPLWRLPDRHRELRHDRSSCRCEHDGVCFCKLDAGMASQLVTIKVLERLKSRYGNLYNEDNLASVALILMQGQGAICIELSIVQAHENLSLVQFSSTRASTFVGDVENAGISRSPSAYLVNPADERARYSTDVDTEMTLLKFINGESGKSIGAFSWFATHGTSMNKDNRLISGDNKGAAARFFEDWFTFTTKSSSKVIANTSATLYSRLIQKAKEINATGGISCGKTTSQASKYPDEILSTKIIGERQFQTAVDLFKYAKEELTGKVDYHHTYLNFTDIEVELDGNNVVRTCPAALGPGFAAGTTDGPGFPGFQQGDTEISEEWKRFRDSLKKPSKYQEDCQQPKPILLDTGEMFKPYAWAPAILPIQILRLGKLVILSVPGEFTTMAGRRLREAVKETLVSNGNGEFDDDTHIVIAVSQTLTRNILQLLKNTSNNDMRNHILGVLQGALVFSRWIHRIIIMGFLWGFFNTLWSTYIISIHQEFKKLAEAMAKGENMIKGPPPPDLSSVQQSYLIDPTGDSPPPGKNLVIRTFAVVEMLQGERWVPAYDDDDFCLYFKWKVESGTFYGLATIEWEVPEAAVSGVYRLRHFGSSKKQRNPQLNILPVPLVHFQCHKEELTEFLGTCPLNT